MARVIVTALSAVTVLFLAIQSLAYRSQSVKDADLSGNSQEAFNLSQSVATDMTNVLGTAIPRLFIIVLLALIVGVLLLNRP